MLKSARRAGTTHLIVRCVDKHAQRQLDGKIERGASTIVSRIRINDLSATQCMLH